MIFDMNTKIPLIKIFPEYAPTSCVQLIDSCHFIGRTIVYLPKINYIVIGGIAKYNFSLFDEWLKLTFFFEINNPILIQIERKANFGEFVGISSTLLSDYTLVIAGKDFYSLALIRIVAESNIIAHERIAQEKELSINYIVSENSLEFYAVGYIIFQDTKIKLGYISKLDKNLHKILDVTLPLQGTIIKIVISGFNSIFGIANIEKSKSSLFSINDLLELSSFFSVVTPIIYAKGIIEITSHDFVVFGHQANFSDNYLITYDKYLNLKKKSKSYFVNPLSYDIIKINSIALTSEGNLVNVGQYWFHFMKQMSYSYQVCSLVCITKTIYYEIADYNKECAISLFDMNLKFINFKTFGPSCDKEESNRIISLMNNNLMMIGNLQQSNFIRFFNNKLDVIKDVAISEPNLKFTYLSEINYGNILLLGYQYLKNSNTLTYFNFRIEFSCPVGYFYDNSKIGCREICGDNIDLQEYECDNSNRLCCDSNCILQPYYLITINKITKEDECHLSYIINSIYSLFYVNGVYIINVKFSQNITLCDDIKRGYIQEAYLLDQVVISSSNANSSKVNFKITSFKYSFCNSLNFSFEDPKNVIVSSKFLLLDLTQLPLKDQRGLPPENLKYNFKLKALRNNSQAEYSELPSSKTATFNQIALVSIGASSSVLSSILGGGIKQIFNFIGPLQIIMMFSMINIHPYPTDVNDTLNANSIISLKFDFLFNPMNNILQKESILALTSDLSRLDNVYNHPSLNNGHFILNIQFKCIIIITFVISFLIIYAISRFCNSFKRLVYLFSDGGFLNLFQSLFFELLICSVMQIFHPNYKLFWVNNLSNTFAFIFLISIILVWIKIFAFLQNHSFTSLKKVRTKKIFGLLYSEVRENSIAKYHMIAFYLRRLISIFLLFVLAYDPIAQSIGFFLCTAIYLIWILIGKPIKNRIVEVAYIIQEIIIIMIHFSFILLSYDYKNYSLISFSSLSEFIIVLIQLGTLIENISSILEFLYYLIIKIKNYYKNPITNLNPSNKEGPIKKLIIKRNTDVEKDPSKDLPRSYVPQSNNPKKISKL